MKDFLPRETVLITSREEAEIFGKKMIKDEILACDYHMPISFDPLNYAISINVKEILAKLILKSRIFCVNFMPFHFKDGVLICAHPSNNDKFINANFTKAESDKIDCPYIQEACMVLECEVIEELKYSDKINFIGKVINIIKKKDNKRIFHIEGDIFSTTID